jgi:hypothetical protein
MALGATEIQLDLPQVGMGLADGGRDTAEAVDAVTTIFAGLVGLQRSIHRATATSAPGVGRATVLCVRYY